MRRLWARAVAAVTLLGVAGCVPETNQVAQRYLIGLSEKKILACFGRPDKRTPVGDEQIWVYHMGAMHFQGWLPAIGKGEDAVPPNSKFRCDVRFVLDRHGVSQVFYSNADGGPVPLGESCDFAVRQCVER
jgi:hypothetical protein